MRKKKPSAINPSHYTSYKGLEIIQLTEQMNFCRGNAVKYIARAGLKDKATEIQDLRKAVWYIKREIRRVKKNGGPVSTPPVVDGRAKEKPASFLKTGFTPNS